MATGTLTATHPWLACVATVAEAVDAVLEPTAPDPDYLPVDDKAALLVGLDREITRLIALKARVLAGADDVAERHGARDASAWLSAVTHSDGPFPRSHLRLGRRLLHRPATAAACAAGSITTEHAVAVLDSVDRLPSSIGPELVADAERRLVGLCAHHTPREVRRLGAHVLEVVAPDDADALLEKQLADQERRARARTRCSIRQRGDGSKDVRATLPELAADIFASLLEAWTNPHRAHHDGAVGGVHEPLAATGDPELDRLTHSEKLGRAFVHLIEHVNTDGIPLVGGTPVAVTVTISEEKLRKAAGAAIVDASTNDGTRLSVGAVRRLLCNHGAFPAVLSGTSMVLDHGRRKRLYTGDQVRTGRLTQTTCRAAGCTVPSRWCEAHHLDPWSRGGLTNLDKLVFLCPHHHHLIHDLAYEHRFDLRGRVTFTRINRRT